MEGQSNAKLVPSQRPTYTNGHTSMLLGGLKFARVSVPQNLVQLLRLPSGGREIMKFRAKFQVLRILQDKL